MKKNRIIFISVLLAVICISSCKKELNVNNPNQPGTSAALNEAGLLSLTEGTTYINGFDHLKWADGGLGATFYTGVVGIHDLMGDVVGSNYANVFMNQLSCPDKIVLDDGTVLLNPNSPPLFKAMIRQVNTSSIQSNGPCYYEWAFMYSLIHAENHILDLSQQVTFSGNATTKVNTLKAWCYWWKGYAYSRLGSLFYAGLINNWGGDNPTTNGNYVSHDTLIAESNRQLDLAAATLATLTDDADYESVLSSIIPAIFLVGKGGILTPDMWIRNINTLKARNILVNTRTNAMTSDQWNSILTLTSNGVKLDDYVFTGRSNSTGDFMTATDGNLPAKTISSLPGGNMYVVSERLIQEYDPADQRLANNYGFDPAHTFYGNVSNGTSFNTRYRLLNGGAGLPGVIVLGSQVVGAYELEMVSTYEENQLMTAEADINTGAVEAGLAIIDALRTQQGAGLPSLVGTGLSADQAKEQLRRERRVELAFRGLSFYDARRWGVIYDGRTGCVVIDFSGHVNTNATIIYGSLDYWDVPDHDLVYNPPAAGSFPVKNPN